MFWPIVLPFILTSILLIVFVCYRTLREKAHDKRISVFFLSLEIGLVLFIPSCGGILVISIPFQFGEFHYSSYNTMFDQRIKKNIPPTATDITVNKQANGFDAKFTISEEDLVDFINQRWLEGGADSAYPRGTIGYPDIISDADSHQYHFGKHGWKQLPDGTLYDSPSELDGGGFYIWYCPSLELAYQSSADW